MPNVHTRHLKQKHYSKQGQSPQQQRTRVNSDHSLGTAAIPLVQIQEVVSTSSVSSQSSREQSSPTSIHPKESQSNESSRPPDSQQQLSEHSKAENDGQRPSIDVVTTCPAGTQSGEGRKISCEDIQLVQNLIERCLQLYMNQAEVIETLLNHAKIETGFTTLVWQKLEEQNPDFFKAYYTRLKLKKHITLFNHLLDQHVQMMQKMRMLPTKTAFPPSVENGLHHLPYQSVPLAVPMPQQSVGALPGCLHTTSPSTIALSPLLLHAMQDSFQSSHGSPGQSGITDIMEVSTSLNSPGADMQFESMTAVPNNTTFPFNGNVSSPDMSSIGIGLSMTMPPDSSFCTSDQHAQNGMSLSLSNAGGGGNHTGELLGSLDHLPRNFSMSDLTAELSSHSDFGPLGSYSSPFATSEMENLLRDPGKETYDTTELLDGVEEPMGKECSDLK